MAGLGSGDPLLLKALGMIGPRLWAEIAWSLTVPRPRSLAAGSRRAITHLHPQPKVEGIENIPAVEPFLLVANHYQTPGLWVGWVALTITAAVASARQPDMRELRWMVAAEWRGDFAGRELTNPLTSVLFPRAARAWGMIAIPAHHEDVAGRARSLMEALGYLGLRGRRDGRRGEPVAIFPEGTGSVKLREAKLGSGAFIHRVNSMGVPVLPVGVHEERGTLVARFGKPFCMPQPPTQSSMDDWAREKVMVAIGRLLPKQLWGAYAETIERESRFENRESGSGIRDSEFGVRDSENSNLE